MSGGLNGSHTLSDYTCELSTSIERREVFETYCLADKRNTTGAKYSYNLYKTAVDNTRRFTIERQIRTKKTLIVSVGTFIHPS